MNRIVDLNDSGSDVEFSKRYDDRPMSGAAVAALAAEYAGFVGAPAQSQLIGRRFEASVRKPTHG
jgi:hypothetical protein